MIRDSIANILQNKNTVMFITAIVFMAGILSCYNDNSIITAFIISFISIIFIIKNYMSLKYIIFFVLVFYAGFFNAHLRTHNFDDLTAYDNSKIIAQGQIVSIPNSNTSDKTKFFFKVDKVNDTAVKGKTLVSVSSDDNDFSMFETGNYYVIKGRIKTPFKAGNPSQFSYGKYLRNFDTFTVMYANKSDCQTSDKKLSMKWKFLNRLNNLRDRIINVHSKYLHSPDLEILGGIVFGDDAVAPPDYIKASFVNSGLLHILAASGMNVAFIYGFWLFFLKRMRAPFKFSVISGMVLVIIYTMMTGLGASVIRAALMLLLILFGKLIDRDAHSVALLALVAMLMLIYNPAFINDVGFQLSFVVTFGLLTTANIIFDRFKESKTLSVILGFLLIPVVAQIWVIPIQMFYFNTISTYSIFANILSVPFLSVVSFGGFLSSIAAIFSPLTDNLCLVLDFILHYVLTAIVCISNYFANLPHSLITTTHPSILQLVIYYSLVLLLTFSIRGKFSKNIGLIFAALLLILCITTINLPSKYLDIITFDVQNADCFLVKTPQNKYFIIDTGRAGYNGGKAQANSIIIKYMKDKGIKNIEGLIITHFDNDHSGGAYDIMNNFNVKHVYVNSFDNKSMTSFNVYKIIKGKNLNASIPKGLIYKENGLKITTYQADEKSDNERSIIALLSYRDFDMLFTGDAGVSAYNRIKNQITGNIEVLKVGHHGGPHVVDSGMIENLHTKVSIISTGPNAFGHPNRGTLDVLRNTDIYRTDRHNSIEIKSNGSEYKTYTYSPEKHKYMLSKTYIAN